MIGKIFGSTISFLGFLVTAGFLFLMVSGPNVVAQWLPISVEEDPTGVLEPFRKETVTIILDPGHGGRDGGGVGNGLVEKVLNLDLAHRVAAQLRDQGYYVEMTRTDDQFPSLRERCDFANRYEKAVFVSIHFNKSSSPSVHGAETFFCHPKSAAAQSQLLGQLELDKDTSFTDKRGEMFAKVLQREFIAETGAKDRGPRNEDFAVVSHVVCPAVLIECGFMSNVHEAEKLKRAEYMATMTRGVVKGISAFVDAMQGDPHFGIIMETRG